MRFWALTVSLIPKDNDLFYQSGKERDVSLVGKALYQFENVSHKKPRNLSNIILGKIIEDNGNLLGFYAKKELAHLYDENFNKSDTNTFPPKLWIWDVQEQTFLIQLDKKTFGHAEKAATVIENLLNHYLSREQIEARVYPKLQEDSFWEVVHSLEAIHELHFEYATPNLFGKTKEDMTNFLKEVREYTNANVFVTELKNDDGNLKPRKDGFLDRAIDWIKDGGGKWSVVGKQNSKSRKTKIGSGKQAKIYNLSDGSLKIETENYSANELVKIIKELRPNYTFRRDEEKS